MEPVSEPLLSALPEAHEASLLLHHLLNQSLTSLDFCILWQSLVEEHPSLKPVAPWVDQFLLKADLGALDRALALLPEPEEGAQLPVVKPPTTWKDGWSVISHRVRDTTRAEFRCPVCGWDIVLSLEHAANTEMRLPFDEIECPVCTQVDEADS